MDTSRAGGQNEIKSKIYDFYVLANDKNLANKNEVLSEKSKILLEELALKKSNSVSLADKEFLDSIILKITTARDSLTWEQIPPPEKLLLAFEDLAEVNSALQTLQMNFFPDIVQVMKELISINGKQQLQKMREAMFGFQNQLISAEAQFSNIEKANKQQKNADNAQAAGQLVSGVVSGVASGLGVIKSVKLARKHKSLLQTAELSDSIKKNNKSLKTKFKEFASDIVHGNQENMTKKGSGTDQTGSLNDAEKKLKNAEELQVKIEKKAKEIDDETKLKLDRLRDESTLINFQSQFIGAFSGVVNSFGSFASADFKYKSSDASLNAQKDEFQKSISQNFSQDALEKYRAIKESIDAALQAVRSIMQALDSAIKNAV
jgi:hypothetical protein